MIEFFKAVGAMGIFACMVYNLGGKHRKGIQPSEDIDFIPRPPSYSTTTYKRPPRTNAPQVPQVKDYGTFRVPTPPRPPKHNTNERCSYDTSFRYNTKPNYDKAFDPNKFTEQWLDNNLD